MAENDTSTQRSRLVFGRLARGFLHRDWATVIIELILIVLGVLIAIELDRWNTERVKVAQEDFYVEWISTSLGESVARGERSLVYLGESIEAAMWVADRLYACDLPASDYQMFADRLLAIGPWDYADLDDAPLIELRTAGNTEVIRSRELRRTLGELEGVIRNHRAGIRNLEAMMRENFAQLNLMYDVRYFEGDAALRSTFESLCESPELARRVAFHVRGYIFFRDFSSGLIEFMKETRASLPVSG
jgi:hypothetical protein